jgi:hypothetical protein
MEGRGSTAEILEAADPPSVVPPLPILPRIQRIPKIDLGTWLWPIERAARTPGGRTIGKVLATATCVVALAAFAWTNSRGRGAEVEATADHPATASVHVHRGLAKKAGVTVSRR